MGRDSDRRSTGRRARLHTRKHPRDKKNQPHHKEDHQQPPNSEQSQQHHDKSLSHGQKDKSKSQDKDNKAKENDNAARAPPQPETATSPPPPPSLPAPPPLPVAKNTAPQPSITASSPVTSLAGTRAVGTGGAKPSVAVIAGVALGAFILILILGSIVAFKCSQRKKRNAPASLNADVQRAASFSDCQEQGGHVAGRAVDRSFSTYGMSSQLEKPIWAAQGRSAEVALEQGHVSFSLSPPRSRDLLTAENDHHPRPPTGQQDLQQDDSTQPGFTMHEQVSPCTAMPSARHEADVEKVERACEGDDNQIDRCLSYYMKRRTCASVQSPPLPAVPAPLPTQHELSTLQSATRDRSSRKSFKFPKTANLFEKIRRSQIRLNDEALSKARGEGLHISPVRDRSSRLDSKDTWPSRYDQSSSSIPAHWRCSTKLDRSEQLDDEDVLGSSPHSAFEYADYYDSYLPGPYNSAMLQPSQDDFGRPGFGVPWQNDSPCRSSALSPRRSTTVSVRQRSATFSQASPCWPPSASPAGHDSSDRRGHLSHVSIQSRAESMEAGEVIRF